MQPYLKTNSDRDNTTSLIIDIDIKLIMLGQISHTQIVAFIVVMYKCSSSLIHFEWFELFSLDL